MMLKSAPPATAISSGLDAPSQEAATEFTIESANVALTTRPPALLGGSQMATSQENANLEGKPPAHEAKVTTGHER